MSYLAVLGSINVVYLLAAASPGPNFLIVTRTSAGFTRREGILTALGVTVAGTIWASAAVLGLSFVFERFVWFYGALKLLGGAYLIFLGVTAWLGATVPPDVSAERNVDKETAWRCFWTGVITNLTNPKALVFFGSIFTALLPPDASGWLLAAAVAVVAANSFWWHCVLALLFSTGRAQRAYRRAKVWIDRASGSVMAILGVRLLLSSR